MKFAILLFLSLNSLLLSDCFDKMFLSLCKSVCITLKDNLINNNYISIKSKPKSNFNNNISLFIFKGNNIKANNYIGISKVIQKIGSEKGLNIDIKIPNFIKTIKKENNIPSFILGHSSGVYDFLLNNNITNYNGLIQIGSVLNSNGILPWKAQKLKEFPIPVLTLIGERDGYLRYPYCLDEVYNQNELDKYIIKPIIILKDITHLHISNTTSTTIAKYIGLNDLESTLETEKAWEILSICIVDYIILNMNQLTTNDNYNSLDRMKNIQYKTQEIFDSYYKYDNYEYISRFLNYIHYNLFYYYDFNNTNINFYNYYDFLISKPDDNSVCCYIQDKSYLFSKTYFTPLWVKTKYNLYISAKKINEYLFNQIAKTYDAKFNIIFKNDRKCLTSLEWVLSGVNIQKDGNNIYIQSPIFITDNTAFKYKNFYYFKILSPAQIIELINIDLKNT